MGPDALLAAFLALFAANLGLDLLLNLLNRREVLRHRGPPPVFAGRFDVATFARSRAYTLDRLAFARVSALWSAAVLLVLLLSGALPALDAALGRLLGDGPARGAAFLAAIVLAQGLLDLPLSAWATFRLEGRHGFNTMTWSLYWRDLARGALLSAALGLPLLYALLWIQERAGARWWIWAFLLVLLVQVVLLVLYPVLIAPLFNRFKPLEEGPLKTSLLELADSLRFPARDIFVMDGSRRSLHSNAYFTGFGRFRRIVLFDTLVGQMEPRELRGVLAHEIGHYKLGHIARGLLLQSLLLLALFWAASLALGWAPLYQAFGFAPPAAVIPATASGTMATGPAAPGPAAAAVGLFLFSTSLSCFSLLLAPFRNLLSRRHEYQADAFAAAACGDAEAMRSALFKLSSKNLSNLTPHPWYSAFHYSHPALRERLAALSRAG